MNKLFVAFILSLLSLTSFAAEDVSSAAEDVRPIVSIAQRDIQNKTDVANPNFGSLIDRINHELTESGLFRVMNENDVAAAFRKEATDNVVASGMKDVSVNRSGMMIYLSIVKYGMSSGGTVDLLTGKTSAEEVANVELIMRVIGLGEGQKGETLKSCNVESGPVMQNMSADIKGNAAGNLKEQVLQAANRIVAKKIVDVLVQLTPFSVLDVDNGEVVVDVPSSRVKPGQQLVVYKKGKKIKNKRTGKVTAKESQVATIGVVTLSEDSVTCKLLAGEIKKDDEAEDGFEYDKYVVKIPDAPAAAVVPATPPATPTGSAAAPF